MRVLYLPYSEQSITLAEMNRGHLPDTTLMGINHLPENGIDFDILDPPNWRLAAWFGQIRNLAKIGTHVERCFLQQIAAVARRKEYDCLLVGSKVNALSDGLIRFAYPIKGPPVVGMDIQLSADVPFRRLVGLLLSEIEGFAVLSRHIAEDLKDLGVSQERIWVLQYGVDRDFFRPCNDESGPDVDVISVGHACRDFATLLRAVQDTFTVRILSWGVALPNGGSQSSEDLRQLCHPMPNAEVSFAEPVALRRHYSRSRVVVVPLFPTGLCAGITTLLEAMAMGKAPIVSWNRNVIEYVDDGKNGLIARPNDPKDLRQKIQFLVDNPSAAARMGRAARKTVEERFSTRKEAANLSRIIRHVVGSAA